VTDTQSVLDQMTAGIMGRKQERATSLTPVGMEKPQPAIAEVRGDVFPHDSGIQAQIIFSAKIIRENLFQMQAQLAGMEDCLRSIEREVGLADPLPPIVPIDAVKDAFAPLPVLADRIPEPTFEEKFAAQQTDAQAQAFSTTQPMPVAPTSSTPMGWACPEHGDNVIELRSKKGRAYHKCRMCTEFERST
jgi:hypothetical protein